MSEDDIQEKTEGAPNPKVAAKGGRKPKPKADKRARLFIPTMNWREFAAVVAMPGVSKRGLGLWVAIRLQAKLDGTDWVEVSPAAKREMGFDNRMAHTRAAKELEAAGLIEVKRRSGYTSLVRLVPPQSRTKGDEPDDE